MGRAKECDDSAIECDENGIRLRGADGELLSEYERKRLYTIRQNEVALLELLGHGHREEPEHSPKAISLTRGHCEDSGPASETMPQSCDAPQGCETTHGTQGCEHVDNAGRSTIKVEAC